MKKFRLALFLIGTFQFCFSQSPARTGKDYAVFFYVTDFQPGWASLPETEVEAKALKAELETNFGFSCELVANPTKQQIRNKIREYNARLTMNDQVLHFFSMHGYYSVTGDRGYLVGRDGLAKDEYGDSWLSYDDLRTDLAPCKAKHILLALDACHSGSFDIRSKGGPDAPVYDQAEDCATRFDKTMRYSGRQYCTSGNKEAKTPAKSLFAQRFLEALRKGGDGKLVRFDDLEYWLGKVDTPKPEGGTFTGHEPGGDFMFVKKNSCISTKDRDGDGIADVDDKCPDNFGLKSNSGCPESGNTGGRLDSDYDGVPDKEDKCPDKFGTKENFGCPEKVVGNDIADADYDGVPDDRDACPSEYGSAKANGCPDQDNDGVPDKSDECKSDAGEVKWQGCPDSDGDGLPDHEDMCPNQKGLIEEKGCPPADSDMDGVPDKSDMCKDKAGGAKWQGCPDSDGDGLPDHEDQCPYQRGLLAEKGCPPPDRDGDGVPDKSDKCPDQAGMVNLEGCPDPKDTNGVKPFELVFVKGGAFVMGCASGEKDCGDDEKPSHYVKKLSDFYIGKYEVTQAEWRKVMSGDPPELYNKGCDQCPVESVSWDDVQEFLRKLNAQTGQAYRLPTEAEWEYAALGGSGSTNKSYKYAGGNNINEVAWYTSNYQTANAIGAKKTTHPVGQKKANQLGLFDMSGNVSEWCSDWYDSYYYNISSSSNPIGPKSGFERVCRGGSWYDLSQYCRLADRYASAPVNRSSHIGFRLAMSK